MTRSNQPDAKKRKSYEMGSQETSGWVTRNQAMDMMGCSMVTIIRWERLGLLRTATARRGPTLRELIVINPDDLARMPRKHRMAPQIEPGESSARAFELFDEGVPPKAVVVAIRQTPERVDELYERWLDQGGSANVINKHAKAELERMFGSFQSVAELVARARRMFMMEAT